jgi:hypothetical protein
MVYVSVLGLLVAPEIAPAPRVTSMEAPDQM